MDCIMENKERPCQAEQDITEIKASVSKMVDALLGTEFTENKGLIYRVFTLELDVKKLKARAVYMAGLSAGVGIFIGFIIEKLVK